MSSRIKASKRVDAGWLHDLQAEYCRPDKRSAIRQTETALKVKYLTKLVK
ncbi:hypothetical protein HMPREF0208_01578 [Citrobacter koseri]|nr:hypothetical protein HMPREF3207_00894 [Citrobacter koseri]KXB45013.1 hypothetical protein HMPREF0208_01578 [Citrobacter koseri]